MESNLIAKYEENGWVLTHSWWLDDFGLKRNSMEVSHIEPDGMKKVYPFMAPLRVSHADKGTAYLGDDTSPFEGFEYIDMLREQVAKINPTNQ